MTDQAEKLRSLVEQTNAQRVSDTAVQQIVVFAGSQTGVGTSTLATNLAIAISRCNTPCVLVDMNYVRPQIAASCRVRSRFPLTDLLRYRRQIRELLQPGPCGVQVLPGQDGLVRNHETANLVTSRIIEAIQPLARSSVVVVDAGADYSVGLRQLCGIARDVLLVTNEDTQAVMDCYALVKRICSLGTNARLSSVVNFASRDTAARDIHARLAVSCERFLNLHFESAATILDDSRIHDASCAGRPFVVYAPQSEAAYQINLIAEGYSQNPSYSRRKDEAA